MKIKIFESYSAYQKIQIFQKENLGKCLYLNNIEQFSEFDENEYHETISNVPLAIHPKPKHILVIGGGDGGVARECLKNSHVESIDVCEIDKNVVDICKEHFPQMTCSFEDPRVNIFYEDGSLFLKNSNKKYDVVIVDSTDPDDTSEPLFGKKFYQDLSFVSKENTIIVLQFEGCFFNNKRLDQTISSIYEVFNYVDFFRCEYKRNEGAKDEYTTFAICSQSNFSIPKNMQEFFKFNNKYYKKIINFKKRMEWLKK